MTPNIPNKTKNQTLQLLRDYYNAPSIDLQEKLVQLNIKLIHKVVLKSVSSEDKLDEQLIQAATTGLVEALQEYNLTLEQTFSSFATPYIHKHVQGFLAIYPQNSLPKLTSSKPSHSTDILELEYLEPHQESQLQHSSFRLSEADTQHLQQLMANLEKQAFRSSESDDTPSGPLKAESLQLLEMYRSQPSPRLRNCLVQLNLGLVRKEAYHWANQCSEAYEDLVQIGSIGLIRAIERFNIDRGHAFSSFAVPYIRGEIQHYLRDKSPTVRMPRRWLVLYNQGCKAIQPLRVKLRREPSDREVADEINIQVSEWQEIKQACQNRSPLSLDAPVHDDEDGASSLGDLVPDAKYRTFQLAQEDGIRLHQALDHLEDRTREIVEFVFLKEFTHREVAEILDISAVTVSRQVKKGLIILKKIMTTPID